jgi:hypothetical protein
MRHFSLFDGMDDGFEKKAADDTFFTIDLGNESALLGLMDVLTWAKNNTEEDFTELAEYLNNLYSEDDYTLRINAAQFSQIRNAFYKFMQIVEQFPSKEEFELVYPDFEIEDIWEAEDALMGAEMEPSSGKGLEDIPTMEKNPEDPVSTTPSSTGPLPPATNAGKAFAAGNCPKCGSPTEPTVLDPSVLTCRNCGWDGDQLPHLGEQSQEIKNLEDAFAAPSVEHPLGPHTGAEEGEQELYTSGRFVNLAKWPSNPVWGVEVAPAAGQRDPMPGDLATIQQKSKAFNRPVPVTLVEDMGGAWTFKNGHHPA